MTFSSTRRLALHATPRYVSANWRLNGIFADRRLFRGLERSEGFQTRRLPDPPRVVGPVEQRLAEPLHFERASTQRSFRFRTLPSAPRDSLRSPPGVPPRSPRRSCRQSRALGRPPLRVCQRWTIKSTYFASSCTPRQRRSVSSAAASVVLDPRKGS
jgi:hypothetical protein